MVKQEDLPDQVPIVASHQSYLAKITAEIRARTIPWEGYQRASLISEDELAQIRQFEKSPSDALAENGEKFVYLFLSLLQKLVRTDTIQNILVLIDDIINENGEDSSLSATKIFYKLAEQKNDPLLPFSPFIKLLKKEDEYIQLKAAKIVIHLLINSPTVPEVDASDLFAWSTTQFSNSNASIVDIAVQYLQSLLSISQYRIGFFNTPNAMSNLVDVLKKSSQAQMQYQIVYVLWLLTFEESISSEIEAKYEIVATFLQYAKVAIKEKVVRIIFATLRNMVEKAPKETMIPLLGNKALNVCETLSARKWVDEEIAEDLEFMKTQLADSVANLSTFDEYYTEVKAGTLDWSPAHKSESFWKVNAARLNEQNHELLRILSRLLSTSKNSTVLAVAAHDLGQYIKYCPSGRKILQEIGAKTQIMELMGHPDQDVRYQALLAVQKLMVNVWTV